MIILNAFCAGMCFGFVLVNARDGRRGAATFAGLAAAINLLAIAAQWGAA
jgi:hypothetical protein